MVLIPPSFTLILQISEHEKRNRGWAALEADGNPTRTEYVHVLGFLQGDLLAHELLREHVAQFWNEQK
jgi:hypothetical protein